MATDGNVKDLPLRLQAVHVNPYKKLGLERESTDISKLREIFRKSCLALIPQFVGFGKPRLQADQLNYAYNLVRGTIKGTPKDISESIENSPYFDFEPDYILPLLRPLQTVRDESQAVYRGFKLLTVGSVNYSITTDSALFFPIPIVKYDFDVNYVLRRHKIQRTYKQFEELHAGLEQELLVLPVLPPASFSHTALGERLALFLMRVHCTLASRGLFSPRLMKFLDIDTEKVQTEEEGTIVKILDGMVKPSGTVWYMVDEKWLRKWRKFVMGRGPRRYFPPGKVDNSALLEKVKAERKDLKLGVDYRCVNYNVWRFFELVHGGGPVISRVEEEIYSQRGMSLLQAQIRISVRMRIFLAKKRRDERYMARLSATQVGKGVMIATARSAMKAQTEEMLRQHHNVRVNLALNEAVKFTQAIWRRKKKYVVLENLEAKRADQERFMKAKGVSKDVPVSYADGVVIEDIHPIVKMGSTNTYSCTISETQGGAIPFTIAKRPGTEDAIISETREKSQYFLLSKILSINQYPTDMMSYEEIKRKLSTAPLPIELIMQKPTSPSAVPTLLDLATMRDDAGLQYNSFKIMMLHGIHLVKHSKMSSHLTTVRVDSENFYYTSRYSGVVSEEQLWNSVSLFVLKFVLHGEQSEAVKGKYGFLNARQCFEVVSDDRTYLFEVPTVTKLKQLLAAEDRARLDAWTLSHQPDEQQVLQFSEQTSSMAAIRNGGFPYTADPYRFVKSNPDFISAQSDNYKQSLHKELVAKTAHRHHHSHGHHHREHDDDNSSVAGGAVDSGGDHKCAPAALSEGEQAAVYAEVLAKCWKCLVGEVRGSQVFVDRQGIPVRRARPKVTLRKIDS